MSKKTLHIYTRVSSEIQTEGSSLDTQKQVGIKQSKSLGFSYRVWDEGGESSKHENLHNREVLNELLIQVDKGKVKHLFVYDLSRLSRNDTVSFMVKSKLVKNGVVLYTSNGKYDFNNHTDKLMYNILSTFNEYENQLRRDKSVRGKINGMKKGHWKGGDINFGYKLVDKKLQINKEESVHIKKLFQM